MSEPVVYELRLPDGGEQTFTVDPERAPAAEREAAAEWTRLETCQCPNCPLAMAEHPHCPAALDLEPVVHQFGDLLSYTEVELRIRQDEREVATRCDMQTALGSLLGLILATGGCPILSRLRGLARIHMPLQSPEETQFRFVGAWLIGELLERPDQPPSLQGLAALAEDLGQVDKALMQRLRRAAREDASYNALAMLAASALSAQFAVDEAMADVAPYAIR